MNTISDQLVQEARTWVGTPYHHQARVKGVGVDCANLIAGIAEACGYEPVILQPYSTQWHLHNSEEKLLNILESYGCTATTLEEQFGNYEGSIITFKFGHVSSHVGIFTSPNTFVHADVRIGKVTEVSLNGQWANHFSGIYKLPERTIKNDNSKLQNNGHSASSST